MPLAFAVEEFDAAFHIEAVSVRTIRSRQHGRTRLLPTTVTEGELRVDILTRDLSCSRNLELHAAPFSIGHRMYDHVFWMRPSECARVHGVPKILSAINDDPPCPRSKPQRQVLGRIQPATEGESEGEGEEGGRCKSRVSVCVHLREI